MTIGNSWGNPALALDLSDWLAFVHVYGAVTVHCLSLRGHIEPKLFHSPLAVSGSCYIYPEKTHNILKLNETGSGIMCWLGNYVLARELCVQLAMLTVCYLTWHSLSTIHSSRVQRMHVCTYARMNVWKHGSVEYAEQLRVAVLFT